MKQKANKNKRRFFMTGWFAAAVVSLMIVVGAAAIKTLV